MRVTVRPIAIAVVALLGACSGAATETATDGTLVGDAASAAVSQKLHDGAWTLTVNRALRVGSVPVAFPSTRLPEEGFTPISAAVAYRLAVSEHGSRIEVTEPRMVARLEQATADRLTYNVAEGTFAGGRIVVWRTPTGDLQGELTIFGSGLPVVKSERGSIRALP